MYEIIIGPLSSLKSANNLKFLSSVTPNGYNFKYLICSTTKNKINEPAKLTLTNSASRCNG